MLPLVGGLGMGQPVAVAASEGWAAAAGAATVEASTVVAAVAWVAATAARVHTPSPRRAAPGRAVRGCTRCLSFLLGPMFLALDFFSRPQMARTHTCVCVCLCACARAL